MSSQKTINILKPGSITAMGDDPIKDRTKLYAVLDCRVDVWTNGWDTFIDAIKYPGCQTSLKVFDDLFQIVMISSSQGIITRKGEQAPDRLRLIGEAFVQSDQSSCLARFLVN